MMTDEDVERIDAHIPTRLKEKLKQGDATQKEQIVEALEIYFGEGAASSRAAIERQLQRLREKKARAEHKKATAEDQIQQYKESIGRLTRQLESMDRAAESYEEALDDHLAFMEEDHTSIFVGHPSLEGLASDFGKSQQEILDDMRERSDLHRSFFTEGAPEPDSPQEELPWRGGDE